MKYVCSICGHVYDEDKEQVAFDSLSDDYRCPLCGALKSDFVLQKEESKIINENKVHHEEDLKELNVGQLAALCSNLARGCEKQYRDEESKLFLKLAAYFDSISPSVDGEVEDLAKALLDDISNYSRLRQVADENKDRGAARVCVWGEKVTRMLSSLVKRYLVEKETMLENTSIWVCSICGFVYIGDNAPELCPVCKVPAWKFDKIEGGNK